MPQFKNEIFFNLLLTQKPIVHNMAYDEIEKLIQTEIDDLKARHLNAKDSKFSLNIHGKLELAQLSIERKNGFVPVKDTQYGTFPTCYNIQFRFPHGLSFQVSAQEVVLPSGDFAQPIAPYYSKISTKVCCELLSEVSPQAVRAGEGVVTRIEGNKPHIYLATDQKQNIAFSCPEEESKGYPPPPH